MHELNLQMNALKAAYQTGELTPRCVIQHLCEKAETYADQPIFIHRLDMEALEPYLSRLEGTDINSLPLWGVPFVIKDNIDLAGVPTTAACPSYAYTPSESAKVVDLLIQAGAIPLGKTNLDQFATGLVGTRSPYGAVPNAFDPSKISGGSSSGSAVAVALNLCSFSLGTDTAGSGRVPAAFNNLVGLKPSKGLLSTQGLIPAVRSQDVISVFALNSDDAYQIMQVVGQYDEEDAFSRDVTQLTPPVWNTQPVIGVPDAGSLFFDGDAEAKANFQQAVNTVTSLGYKVVEVPFQAWLDTAKLLYGGAWVAERFVAIESFLKTQPEDMDPSVAAIIKGATQFSAADAYRGSYDLMEAQRLTQQIWQKAGIDCMMTPTAPTHYSLADIEEQPIERNSKLGTYTNFMNLLDYAAVAMPSGFRDNGLPFGVTFFAPAGTDAQLLNLSANLHPQFSDTVGAKGLRLVPRTLEAYKNDRIIPLAVVGAHLSGFPLNAQLQARGAKLMEVTQTAPKYRFYELKERPILKPGLIKQTMGGSSIELEVWAMPREHLGSFLALIPSPLGLGKVELHDGREVVGFICEPYGVEGAKDISDTGGWRKWMTLRAV